MKVHKLKWMQDKFAGEYPTALCGGDGKLDMRWNKVTCLKCLARRKR